MTTVPEITRAEWNDDYVRRGQPCLIVDGLDDWPAKAWSAESLQARYADRPVTVQVSHGGRWKFHGDGSPVDAATQYGLPAVTLGEAVDWILRRPAGHAYYVSQSDIGQYPGLADDLRFSRPVERGLVNLWFGSEGTVSPLHYDSLHNTFAQVCGTKTVTLFDPAETPRLYAHPPFGAMSHLSPVDADEPDAVRHPLALAARAEVVRVEPGQLLYIPAFWWHHVRAHDVSISVNQWWRPSLEECRGETAVRSMLRTYRQDGWCMLRTAEQLTRPRLLEAADAWLRTEPALALIAAAVVIEDLVRRPSDAAPGRPRVSDAVPTAVRALMTTLMEHGPGPLDSQAVRTLVDDVRAVEARSAIPV